MKKLILMGSVLLLAGCSAQYTTETFNEQQLIITVLLAVVALSVVGFLFSTSGILSIIIHVSALFALYGYLMSLNTLTSYAIVACIIGMACIALEFFVPGGVLGAIGLIAIISSLLMAAPSFIGMLYSIIIALLLAIVGMVIMVKFFKRKLNVLNKMVLTDATDTEHGYVSNVNRTELLGQVAITLTPLRPSGTAKFQEERLDVVSEGEFIPANVKVEIVRVEGVRIVVRKIES